MSPFFTRCALIAARETYGFRFAKPQNGVPAGSFTFMELYCDDLACDCRRVMLRVYDTTDFELDNPLATIHFGWETPDFYQKWLKTADLALAEEMTQVTLEASTPQGPDAPAFRNLVEWMIYENPGAVDRWQRHYEQYREALREEQGGRRGGAGKTPRRQGGGTGTSSFTNWLKRRR